MVTEAEEEREGHFEDDFLASVLGKQMMPVSKTENRSKKRFGGADGIRTLALTTFSKDAFMIFTWSRLLEIQVQVCGEIWPQGRDAGVRAHQEAGSWDEIIWGRNVTGGEKWTKD